MYKLVQATPGAAQQNAGLNIGVDRVLEIEELRRDLASLRQIKADMVSQEKFQKKVATFIFFKVLPALGITGLLGMAGANVEFLKEILTKLGAAAASVAEAADKKA